MRIALEFRSSHDIITRARLRYAFRLFCAIYGHEPVTSMNRTTSVDLTIRYGQGRSPETLLLGQTYSARPFSLPAPPPQRFSPDGDETYLIHPPLSGEEPDWLGEIFEWVSCADEYSVYARDSVGRIPFTSSYLGRHRLDPTKPYAAIAMRFLQAAIAKLRPQLPLEPPCPVGAERHLIVNTHDVDFLPFHRLGDAYRLAKNALISLASSHSISLAARQTFEALAVLCGGHDPLDQLPHLLNKEDEYSIGASYYFLSHHDHRRDANYRLSEPATIAAISAVQKEMEVGLHYSYTCLNDASKLAGEIADLRRHGVQPTGGRQHWLRFTLPTLIAAAEQAEIDYDASLGWIDVPGYRAGACFSFPPYDFARECAAPFLEVPLVVTDQCVAAQETDHRIDIPLRVLSDSRKYGWGGVSILWHPTAFGGGQFSPEIGEAFWRLAEASLAQNDRWLSAASFVERVWNRYSDVGLLPKTRPSQNQSHPYQMEHDHVAA